MSLINHTYFTDDLLIPGLENSDIQGKVQRFIDKHEPALLQDILGYELFKAFTDALAAGDPDQKWIDLRDGVEFTRFNGYKEMWPGFTGLNGNSGVTASLIRVEDALHFQYKVGRGYSGGTPGNGDYWEDPAINATELIDERLNGATKDKLSVREAGYGDKLHEEYDLRTGGGIILLGSKTFNNNTGWFIDYQKVSRVEVPEVVDTEVKQSLIANFVYCRYMKNEHTQSVRLGEVKPALQNAEQYNAGAKIVRAWNEMAEWISIMAEFLEVNRATYPEWDNHNKGVVRRRYHPINQFGI